MSGTSGKRAAGLGWGMGVPGLHLDSSVPSGIPTSLSWQREKEEAVMASVTPNSPTACQSCTDVLEEMLLHLLFTLRTISRNCKWLGFEFWSVFFFFLFVFKSFSPQVGQESSLGILHFNVGVRAAKCRVREHLIITP